MKERRLQEQLCADFVIVKDSDGLRFFTIMLVL